MYPSRQRLSPDSPSQSPEEAADRAPSVGANSSKHRNGASLSPYERTLQRMREGAARSVSLSATSSAAAGVCGVCLDVRGAAATALFCGHCGRSACIRHSWACGSCTGTFCSLCGTAATAGGEECVRCPACQALTSTCDSSLPSAQPAVEPSARRSGGIGISSTSSPCEAMLVDGSAAAPRGLLAYFTAAKRPPQPPR